jgi:clan AA aspartic protease (TIGR02281 family)
MLSVAILSLFGVASRADSIYKCKDQQGKSIYQGTPCEEDVVAVSSWQTAIVPVRKIEEPPMTTGGLYVVKQRGDGHYFIDGTINGKPLTFLVDTGASAVSLPREIAYMANMSCDEQVRMNTANGTTSVCLSVISKLKFGPFLLKNVSATIVPNLDQPLMGMNVLQQFKIEQENGEMKISGRK